MGVYEALVGTDNSIRSIAGSVKKPKVKPSVKKEPDSTSKFPKIALMDPTSVRANAKRALYQIIWKR